MNSSVQFGKNLRNARLAQGLSQEALGDRADLHRTEIVLLERAKREPRLSTIVRLGRGLGILPSELLDGIE